jgi:hypothetical protein
MYSESSEFPLPFIVLINQLQRHRRVRMGTHNAGPIHTREHYTSAI